MIKLKISFDQILYAKFLVEHSIREHTVSNIWKNDNVHKKFYNQFNSLYWTPEKVKSFQYRFVGTLGEIVFADYYGLPRPLRSFGAIYGQDYGQDFLLYLKTFNRRFKAIIDVKTMRRNKAEAKPYYVQNLSYYQVNKKDSLTNCYFVITIGMPESIYRIFSFMNEEVEFIYPEHFQVFEALLIGYIFKSDIYKNSILYKKGTVRHRANNTTFVFYDDTYEIEFKNLRKPWIKKPFSKNIV